MKPQAIRPQVQISLTAARTKLRLIEKNKQVDMKRLKGKMNSMVCVHIP